LAVKDTNPKDAVGVRKVPFSTVPARVVAELGLALLEGGRKYGRHNYRVVGVRASVYYDAALRHLAAWWEGEDLDPDSGLAHLTKAMACIAVAEDARHNGKLTDDRPPRLAPGWVAELNGKAGEIIDRYPDALAPYTHDTTTSATDPKFLFAAEQCRSLSPHVASIGSDVCVACGISRDLASSLRHEFIG
jgi:hypothetical protein